MGDYSTGAGLLSVNRNPCTGVFTDTSQTAATINLNSTAGGTSSNIQLYASSAANTTPTLVGTADTSGINIPTGETYKINGVPIGGTGTRQWSCQPGMGDGLNAITAGTYLQSTCKNTTVSTVTIIGVQCFSDAGTSTMNVSGNTLGALLTGAVTCTSSFAAGTQSANVLLTSNDYLKFTFVADGTAKQTTWVVYGTY
jgi:hypothetical protein